MGRPDPNDLVMFATVVRQGSFKKAGEQLGVPHSTISRRVMMLENQLGEKLLQRTTRTLTLTDFGATVLVHAEHVAAEVEATADLIQGRTLEPSGHLRLSMPTDFTSDMLGALITRFMVAHPKILVDVDVSRRRVDLIAENFDLAVRIGDLQDDATLAARRVGTIHMGLYASPGYLTGHSIPDSPDDLGSHEVLHLTQRIGEPMRLRLVSEDKTWEGNLQARVTANSPGILMHMALNGAGIAPLANHLAAESMRSGALVRVIKDWQQAEIPIWAIIPGRRLLPLRTQLFIDALKKELSR
ncbi:LysR family transcriptional regulator (plasmid) [Agrobacterium tumefaciens]|jgi:DNA-binding transcriptional LysR family regulator|nr:MULTISPECIES: LysR family transcriptional regulator [Agrobacterium]NSY46433.1 LysR family transcriptional regulator [Agrobacterium tumefaciens]NSZ76894.1 LysR family transcriptional regulator [Agrobacterium tumefaciens]NSZ87374.1 LysR family transcriptional regulator [Agrobacterium tumefaciens]UZX45321.1 LysR family transcriptional regulator [Agrobacterium sp. 13-2099-1-2]WCA72730.1 LysR family transcriptional regulator [Agrobacterium tumefaciens]